MKSFPLKLALFLWLISTFIPTPTGCTTVNRSRQAFEDNPEDNPEENKSNPYLQNDNNNDDETNLENVIEEKQTIEDHDNSAPKHHHLRSKRDTAIKPVKSDDEKLRDQVPVPWGRIMNKKAFAAFWPPRKNDGAPIPHSQQGLEDWYAYIRQMNLDYIKYIDRRGVLEGELKKRWSDEHDNRTAPDIPKTSRPYPFCVDGKLPYLDRSIMFVDGQPMAPDASDDKMWTKKITFERKDCSKIEDCHDKDIYRFNDLFGASQPIGPPVVAGIDGKPSITHLVNGQDAGPYIQSITFTKIHSPRPPKGISWYPPDGSPEMPYWIHIIVKSRIPLQGLFVQAIGFPMGLPFGNFRDDFDCNAGGLTSERNRKVQDARDASRIIPCKYSHGNNNGDMFPNVYTYGGNPDTTLKPRKEFRMHFTWSSVHCNLKTRVQFLVMAVANFRNLDIETFLTANYLLKQNNAAGSPPPYIPGSDLDYGWDGQMRCDEKNVVSSPISDPARVVLEYRVGSDLPIPADGDYDLCVTDQGVKHEDGTDLLYQFVSDDFHRMLPKSDANNGLLRDLLLPQDAAKDPTYFDANGNRTMINWQLIRRMAQICKPGDICLNESDDLGYETDYDENGHPKDAVKRIREFSEQLKEQTFPDCRISFCVHPNTTVPLLQPKGNGSADEEGGPGFEEEDEEAKNASIYGGQRFSEDFTKEFYKRGSLHFRRARGTHVWCMTFAWFILMALGAFTARYYKETGGINTNATNSILGLGYWIWVHIILFLVSLTFMWIGILETARFRQKPISCNLMETYNGGEDSDLWQLKSFCRWKKKIVRNHRRIGITAVFCYHVALLISWARPVRKLKVIKCKVPFRKIFVWVHVIFAYLGKFLCFVSVMLFFIPKAKAICRSIPIIVVVTEFFSIVFFAAGWVMQFLEDKTLKRETRRRVFPVPEALEAADSSKCYLFKVILVGASAVVHLILFVAMIFAVNYIYMIPGKGTDRVPGFEDEDRGIGGKCNLISSATELDASMQGYYYQKLAAADVE